MLFIALVWFLITNIFASKGDYVVVYKGNEIVAEYPLNSDNELTVMNGDEELIAFEVRNGSVNVIRASCKDKLCVHQKTISNSKETICCLPNKIVLSIESSVNDEGEYDAVTK